MIFEREKVLNRWAEYIGDLFADERPPLPLPSNARGPPILKSEVERAIKSSQLGKAPGDDLKLKENYIEQWQNNFVLYLSINCRQSNLIKC